MKCAQLLFWVCAVLTSGTTFGFWNRDYDEPPAIIRVEPPTSEEMQRLNFGRYSANAQIRRFGLADHTPLIPDWSKAQSGKLLASWNPAETPGRRPTIVLQHGGVGGPGSIDYGHARWFKAHGYNVLILDSFWSRGFIANWRKIDEPVSAHGRSFSSLGANTRARDAFAAARWLQEQPSVDASRIYLVGGSQGGWSVLRAFTDEKSIAEKYKGLFRAGVAIYPACWSWQVTPERHAQHTSSEQRPRLGPFYGPVFLVTVELEPPGSQTDMQSCDQRLLSWAAQHRFFAQTTHAFDDESPPENPVDRCWYSANPNWCNASGGRDPSTGNCRASTKADFCSESRKTLDLREEILEFFKRHGDR